MAHDLEFGLWNKGGEVAYTEKFSVAARRGKPNPNDDPQVQVSPARAQPVQVASKGKNEQRLTSRERYDQHQVLPNSPVHLDPNILKARKTSSGSNHSRESSPLDPRIQAKAVNNGSPGTPSKQKGGSNRTPGRSKLMSSFESSSEEGGVIPKIGEWDPKDPAGDKFTGKFKILQTEKERNNEKVSNIDIEPRSHPDKRDNGITRFCCFRCLWFRKSSMKSVS